MPAGINFLINKSLLYDTVNTDYRYIHTEFNQGNPMFASVLLTENKKVRRELVANVMDHVYFLAGELGERTLREYDNLNQARYYIKDYFREFGHEPWDEKYTADGMEVANVAVEITGYDRPDDIIVVGAHYDTIEDSPGADDNASAIAGLLELYRLLSPYRYKKTVRFVAFTLEEPPFFSSELMGSMQYSAGCKKRNENIELMICLEMIGFGSKKCPQEFPLEEMKRNKPPYGDYLGVFSLPSSAPYVSLWKDVYNTAAKRKIHDIVGPASIPGMDLSDHRSFVARGYPAIMLSDSGYYRNKNYHTPGDTPDTLNYNFLAENVHNSHIALRDILNMDKLIGPR